MECRIVTASVIRSGDHQLRVGFQKFLRLLCHKCGILGFQTLAVGAMSAPVMLGKKVVVGCVVYTRLAFRLVELVLFKVGCVVFLKIFLEQIERVTAPIVTIALLQMVLVHVFWILAS